MIEAPSFSPRPNADALREDAWVAPLIVLRRHRVEHIIAGDVAAAAYGGTVQPGTPVTIVPAQYGRNLERLAAARAEIDGAALQVISRPAGTEGFRDLLDDARIVTLGGGLDVLVASSEDLERMREASSAA
jgi:hypothetical protein